MWKAILKDLRLFALLASLGAFIFFLDAAWDYFGFGIGGAASWVFLALIVAAGIATYVITRRLR